MLAEFAETSWRAVAPRLVTLPDKGDVYLIDGISLTLPIREILHSTGMATWSDVPAASWDPAQRLVYQQAAGLNGELLFPTLGLLAGQHPDLMYRYQFADVYNRWLAEVWCRNGLGQLEMVAILGRHDTRAARSIAIRTTAEHGFRGLLLPVEPSVGRWSDTVYEQFFAELSEAGLLACFHAFTRPVRPGVSRKAAAVFAAPHQAMDVFCEMAIGNVLAKTPGLRVLFGEGGTWWLPHWIKQMEVAGTNIADLERGLRVTSDTVPSATHRFAVFASDFPHGAGSRQQPKRITLSGAPNAFIDGSFWRRD
jgi:Amidohydrolase